jgi:hypothetical protein
MEVEFKPQAVLLPEGTRRNLTPVKRQAADSYLILFIAAFGITVILVRIFLELSGYPQIGNSTFHIAHLLWGGVLLFVSVILTLIWANNWVLWASALMGGIGVGLFIDEVGKFITQDNDYFFPLAFPIIYAFLLVCVWLLMRVRRSRQRDTRTLLYHALSDLKQVIDKDLDPFEHKQLVDELNQVQAAAQDPNERILARALLDFVHAEELQLAREPNLLERWWNWIKFIAARWPSQRVFRGLLVLGFGYMGIRSIFEIAALVVLTVGGAEQLDVSIADIVIVSGKSRYTIDAPLLLIVHAAGIIVTGMMSAVASTLFMLRRDRAALRAGTLSLALSLTVVNLLTFYFSQLYALGSALLQLGLLLAAAVYRWRFFLNK